MSVPSRIAAPLPPLADVLVVGLGHAGCEAALACARLGLTTVAVTLRADRAAVMSCNPAVGGTAKGHLVRELDALGGQMGRAADLASTHARLLNASKGPAVQATRVLCDREAYARGMQAVLAAQPGLTVVEGEVARLVVEGDGAGSGEGVGSGAGAGRQRVVGVVLADGRELAARAVVLTTGTFLQALMHVGAQKAVGGRLGDEAATGLSASLRALGFTLGRFKTGTPPRLARASIDWARVEAQDTDPLVRPFSAQTRGEDGLPYPRAGRVTCGVTATTEVTHGVLRAHLHRSPLFSGDITGRGPRYCPSLEDKVVRFAARARHLVFLEPEGEGSALVYPAGLSTSLPADVQEAFLRTIPGLEAVEVVRPGYAVEYDFAPPTQLLPTLETRAVRGLYFAGQLNGTSGYEEAAFQGLWAGLNAGLAVQGRAPFLLARHEAHGAVLVDELVTRGVDEPFRMFTSRSEHRLRLREGNAGVRLAARGAEVGLVSAARLAEVRAHAEAVAGEVARLEARGRTGALRRPGARWADVAGEGAPALPPDVVEEVEVEVKYAGYVAQAERAAAREAEAADGVRIPADFDFGGVEGLSGEARERLVRHRPPTLGHARRLPGLTPAALSLVLGALRRGARDC